MVYRSTNSARPRTLALWPRGATDLELAAGSAVNVMLTASNGAARAAWARAIHDRSARRGHPFVAVSGRARPAIRRAGLTEEVDGWFERAAGGTLFIDHVAGLTPSAQARLLLALTAQADHTEAAAMRPNGHHVRVIAGSSRSLGTDLASGGFSEALFYRLNVIHLNHLHQEGSAGGPVPVRDITSRALLSR